MHVDLAAEFASDSAFNDEEPDDPSDSDDSSVYEYMREVLSLGLLYSQLPLNGRPLEWTSTL